MAPFLRDHICPRRSLSLIFALVTAHRPTEAFEACHSHPLTLARLFVVHASLLNSGPSRGNDFNRNNSEFSKALPSGHLEWSFQDISFFGRKQIQSVIVFPFNMPKECSCTLARAFFFFIQQTLIDLLLCTLHWAVWWEEKVGRGDAC